MAPRRRSPPDPQRLARVVELTWEGQRPAQIARTLKLPLRAVSALVRSLDRHPLGPVALHLAQRASRLAWQASVRRRLEALSSGPVPRLPRISSKRFLEDHYARSRPVVLTSMMKDWKATRRWTLPFLKEHFGGVELRVASNRTRTAWYDLNVHAISEPMRLGDFVDWISRVKVSNERYLVANNDGLADPALRPLLKDIGYFNGLMKRGDLRGSVYLWFGPGGTVTPLHHDTANILFCQVRGRKTFKLVSPLRSELLHDVVSYYSPIDLERPALDRFPFMREAEVLDVELSPGEALFLPAGWWHHVRSHSVSLSVSMTNFAFPNDFHDETR
jgi:hypothetical protein